MLDILSKALSRNIVNYEHQTTRLHGGTVGEVELLEGEATPEGGGALPFKIVRKTQKKWARPGDEDSWRREYDLYVSGLDAVFTDALRWPECYRAEFKGDATVLWMEYIDGASGYELTPGMCERAAVELGRFQGKLYSKQPAVLQTLTNLSKADGMKEFYRYYRSRKDVYDYIRDGNCEIPEHLCRMITDMDEKSDEIWKRVEALPVVLCHRDFWVTNIFFKDDKIILIDWDTAGRGYMGEDIISLIADEADAEQMIELYKTCVPAYLKGFAEYADISHINDLYIYERIVLHFGYRLAEWFLHAKRHEDKALYKKVLQKIHEMRTC